MRALQPRLARALAALGDEIDDDARRLLVVGLLEDLQRSIKLDPPLRLALYQALLAAAAPPRR